MAVRIKVLLVAIFILPFLSACTAKKKTGAVSMTIPATLKSNKVGSLSLTQPVQHAVINISGEGIPDTMTWSWDSHRCRELDSYAVCAPPAQVTIPDVPNGPKLIQVMFVVGEEESASAFWYGDSLTDVQGDNTAANVIIAEYNSVSSLTSGRISGRYYANVYDALGNVTSVVNPTGKVNVRLPAPVAGRRPMLIESTEMYAGWFTVFGLKEIALSYDMPGYGQLFSGPVWLDDADSTYYPGVGTPDDYLVTIPETLSAWDGRKEPATMVLIGSFGNGVGHISVTPPEACEDSSLGGYTYSSIIEPSVPALLTGADLNLIGTPSICGGTPDFINYLSAIPEAHDSQGGRSLLGIQGPFRGVVSGSRYEFVSIGGTDPFSAATISWNYLPGADVASVIDGVKIFIKQSEEGGGGDEYRQDGDGINCNILTSLGFTALNSGNVVSVPTDSLPSVDLSSYGRSTIIVCPVKGDKMLSSAVEGYFEGSSSATGGSGNSMHQATSILITGPALVANDMSTAPCTPFRVSGWHNGKPAGFGSNTNISFTTSSPNVYIYDDSSCSGAPIAGDSVMGPDIDYYDFYLKSKFVSAMPASASVSATMSGSSASYSSSKTFALLAKPSFDSTKHKIKIFSPLVIKAHECYAAMAVKWYEVGATGVVVDNFPAELDFDAQSSEFSYYEDTGFEPPCEGAPISGPSVSISPTAKRFYFRYKGSSANTTANLTFSGGATSLPTLSTPMSVIHPGEPVRVRLETSYSAEVGQCLAVKAIVTDRNGNPTGATGGALLNLYNLGTVSGTFYSDDTCGASTTDVSLADGDSTATFYFEPTNTGSAIFLAMDSGFTPALGGVGSISVETATARYIYAILPGEGLTINPPGTPPTYTGSATAVGPSTSFNVILYALTSDYQLDSSYAPAGTNSSNFDITDMSYNSISTWTAGIATVSFDSDVTASGVINDIILMRSNGYEPMMVNGSSGVPITVPY